MLNIWNILVCLFNLSPHEETHLGPEGTRLEQNAQAWLKKAYILWVINTTWNITHLGNVSLAIYTY